MSRIDTIRLIFLIFTPQFQKRILMSMMFIPDDGWKKLEFDKLLGTVEQYALSAHTKERLREMPISTDYDYINLSFLKITEWMRSKDEKEEIPLSHIEPIIQDVFLLKKIDFVLSPEAILRLNGVIQQHRLIVNHLTDARREKYKLLSNMVDAVEMELEIYRMVDLVFDEEGEVKDSASQELLQIMKNIRSKQKSIDLEFNRVLGNYRNQGLLTDSSESYRNGRRVLSVPVENKRKIKGIIHDESQTGKTVFIEPEALIPLNNDLFDLFGERKREIYRIIKKLCNDLRPYSDSFIDSFELQTEMDIIRSKSEFAATIEAVIPKLEKEPVFSFKRAFHPLLLLKNKQSGNKTVPFDLQLFGQNRLLLISGPNAGGKSILMKAVGLLQLMVQASIPVPVDSDSSFGVFKKICVDIGDQQSIEDDLSTYSSRLKNMKAFSEVLDEESLLLIDEFGSGTDPKIGGAIAEALLRDFNFKKCFGVITSHYSNLKTYAYKTQGIVNGAMIFDQEELQATYEMRIGRPGSSFAFEIASKTGIHPRILSYAKKKVGKNNVEVEDLLTDLQKEKKELEDKVISLEERSKNLERLIKNYEMLHGELEYKRKKLKMEKKAQMLVDKNAKNKELEQVIREIKQTQDIEKAKALQKALKVEKKSIEKEYTSLKKDVYYNDKVDISQFKKGDYVKMRTGSEIGEILKIKGKKAEVAIGIMRMFVPLTELLPAKDPIDTRSTRSVLTEFTSNLQDVDTKLDIRGFSMGEASKIVEDFLDKVLLSNTHEVKIIHGVGNGVLKKVVWSKAKEYKDFSNIFHPEEEQGGEGVSIIQL